MRAFGGRVCAEKLTYTPAFGIQSSARGPCPPLALERPGTLGFLGRFPSSSAALNLRVQWRVEQRQRSVVTGARSRVRSIMAKKAKKVPFDPKVFLATANGDRTLAKYRTDQVVFSQGDPADAVFYIQKGRVKITVISEQGKEAIVAVMGPDDFCGEGCLTGQPATLGYSRRNNRMRDHAVGEIGDDRSSPRGARILRDVHLASFGAHHPG
jgi:hypothetical protein